MTSSEIPTDPYWKLRQLPFAPGTGRADNHSKEKLDTASASLVC
jgi:hypothetical protein